MNLEINTPMDAAVWNPKSEETLAGYLARISELCSPTAGALIQAYAACQEIYTVGWRIVRNFPQEGKARIEQQFFTLEVIQEAPKAYHQLYKQEGLETAEFFFMNQIRLAMQPTAGITLLIALNGARAWMQKDISRERKTWSQNWDVRQRQAIDYRLVRALFGEGVADNLLQEKSRESREKFTSPATIVSSQLKRLALAIDPQNPSINLSDLIATTTTMERMIFPVYKIDSQVGEAIKSIINREMNFYTTTYKTYKPGLE